MWIDEYVELVFGEQYKNNNIPDLLFKYRNTSAGKQQLSPTLLKSFKGC